MGFDKAYFDAGSNVVCTNTFGANALHYTDAELEESMINLRKRVGSRHGE